jgi:hypothetical protein
VASVVLQNKTDKRLYFLVAGDIEAFLSDGRELRLEKVIGANRCPYISGGEQVTIRFCMDEHRHELSYFSYIDPQGQIEMSMRYSFGRIDRGYQPSGSLSFGLKLVTRFASKPPGTDQGEADLRNVTAPSVISLPLPSQRLNPEGG